MPNNIDARTYLAGCALPALIQGVGKGSGDRAVENMAEAAVKLADAVIAKLNATDDPNRAKREVGML